MQDKSNKTLELRAVKRDKNSMEEHLTSYTELTVSATGYSQHKSDDSNYQGQLY